MSLSYTADQAAEALARLVTQYANAPNMQGIISAIGQSVQTLEDTFWQLIDTRFNLSNAFGLQLDNIGTIVDEARAGASDFDYALRLKAKIKANLSSGTIPQLIEIISLITGSLFVNMVEYFPASIVAQVSGGVTPSPAVVADMLKRGRAGGVKSILEYTNDTNGNSFCFANGPGLGFGAGVFAGAI